MSEARTIKIPYTNKKLFYEELLSEVIALSDRSQIATLSNASAAIMQHLPQINWAGFYLYDGSELVLGPFQGLPACLRISLDRGVCGAAARERRTMLVADVHQFPGHIACDAASRSEIVVPIIVKGELFGVLDIDSPLLDRFDVDDQLGLQSIVSALETRL